MKRPNGTGVKPYKLADGRWRAEVTVGWSTDGKRLRRSVVRPSRLLAEEALRDLLRARDTGTLSAGAAVKLEDWLDHWLYEIAGPNLRRSTVTGYESKIRTWITGTRLGNTRLDRVTPEDLDALYSRMRENGSGASAVGMHRILARALKIAVRRGRLAVSPASRMDAPQPGVFEAEPLEVDDARRLVTAAKDDDYGVAWMVALALGPRQSERLGLGWDVVDLERGTIEIKRTLERVPYRHGCDGTCGKRRGVDCPDRTAGGLFFGTPKSRAGSRVLGLPPDLATALEKHKAAQLAERSAEWQAYTDPDGVTVDLVFAQPNGRPIHPRTDYARWQEFLAAAGMSAARVHDARHTTATMLLLLGQDPRVVMELMGWSQMSMLVRYQHVVDELRREAAAAVGTALWSKPAAPPPPSSDGVVVSIDRARSRRSG